MADTRACPYHSLFATRYSLPFLPVAAVPSSSLNHLLLAIRHSPPSSCLPQHFLGATRNAEDMGKDFGGGLIQFGRDEGADGHFHQRLR